jgi:Ring finger domain
MRHAGGPVLPPTGRGCVGIVRAGGARGPICHTGSPVRAGGVGIVRGSPTDMSTETVDTLLQDRFCALDRATNKFTTSLWAEDARGIRFVDEEAKPDSSGHSGASTDRPDFVYKVYDEGYMIHTGATPATVTAPVAVTTAAATTTAASANASADASDSSTTSSTESSAESVDRAALVDAYDAADATAYDAADVAALAAAEAADGADAAAAHDDYDETPCAVCQEAVGSGATVLDCSHQYHQVCIDEWLAQNSFCPICRTPVRFDAASGGVVSTSAIS